MLQSSKTKTRVGIDRTLSCEHEFAGQRGISQELLDYNHIVGYNEAGADLQGWVM